MIRNVLKPDGTAHIEQQVGNMRYDLTTVSYTHLDVYKRQA